ncbi:AI-2E family transporter [Sulfurospirillum barnesii]|uniref:Putative permease n=1 Tax=Sulfurospirillum barnesii (strain ATCC 700032 / DSM 10660 / SES-3) TaxID=760154 RepID=I3XUY8_SULBS|nr:AI-2E family transporter [Sulfurospirillum barnesii]AFL67762.1 putative permease [Sulfurospirillum barnesii SES-3]
MNEHRFFLTAIFLVVLVSLLKLYQPFLMIIAIASLLAMATYTINFKLYKFTKNRHVAAILSTSLLSLLLFGPLIYSLTSIGSIVNNFDFAMIEKLQHYLRTLDYQLPTPLAFMQSSLDEFISSLNIAQMSSTALSYLGSLGKNSAGFLKDMLLIVVFFFFALLNGKDLIDYIKSVMPLGAQEVNMVFAEVTSVMSVVLYSILFSAIFQGMLFSFIGMYFGYDGLLLGIFYGFASLIPIIGGALMWIPLCALEIAHGNTGSAIIIALYSIIVISIIADTFIKPLIIKYINDKMVKTPTMVNELLIFFAIFAGLSTFGFWGMILGPAITTLFISLLKLYKLLKEKSYM